MKKRLLYPALFFMAIAGYSPGTGIISPTGIEGLTANSPVSGQGIEERLRTHHSMAEDEKDLSGIKSDYPGVMILNSRPEKGYFREFTLHYIFKDDHAISDSEMDKIIRNAVRMAVRKAYENDYNAVFCNRKSIEFNDSRHKLDIDVVLYKLVALRA